VGVPVGLSLDFLNGVTASAAGVNASTKDTALGFNLAVMAGARFALSKSVGLLAEIGYSMHAVSHDVKATTPIGDLTASVDYTLEQLALNVGVFF